MGRRTVFVVRGESRARGVAAGFGCGVWLSLVSSSMPAFAAEDASAPPPAPAFSHRLTGPAWTAAMQSAGVLSNGPAFVASPLERNPPPPARLFFNERPIGDPRAPERFRLDTSSLETPISPDAPSASRDTPSPAAPDDPAREETAAPAPSPRPEPPARAATGREKPSPQTRQAARETEPAERPAAVRRAVRSPREKTAARPTRVRQAAREPEPEPDTASPARRPLTTGRSVAAKPSPPPPSAPPLRTLHAREKPAHAPAPVLRIAREPRVPVIALPSSLLPTQP